MVVWCISVVYASGCVYSFACKIGRDDLAFRPVYGSGHPGRAASSIVIHCVFAAPLVQMPVACCFLTVNKIVRGRQNDANGYAFDDLGFRN